MDVLFAAWIHWRVGRSGLPGAHPLGELIRRAGVWHTGAEEEEVLEEIATERRRLRFSRESIDVQDFGAGYSPGLDRVRTGARPARRAVSDIVRRAAVPEVWGRFLFRLVRQAAPERVLELGTSLGIGGAYLAAALRLNAASGGPASGRLVTLEGDPELARRARGWLDRLAPDRVRVVAGRFDDTLGAVIEQEGPFDLVFIDGHHEEEAALRYFGMLRPGLRSGGLVVFDDLEPWVSSVHRAWRRVVRELGPEQTIHLGKMGILRVP